jgi:hypothetical protein
MGARDGAMTQDTLALWRQAYKNPMLMDMLAKAFTQSGSATSGITAYDLEGPAKKLYPVITPLRNETPRVSGAGGIQANWRGITGINTTSVAAGVSQGNRGGVVSTSTKDYIAVYKGIGLEDYATFEADYAAQYYDDIRARTVEGLLRSLMIQEERVILGGNTTLALGTTPTPTITVSTSGGTFASSVVVYVYCSALTLDGYLSGSVTGGVNNMVVRTNADNSVDTYGGGSALLSAVGNGTSTAANSSINASVTAVKGAVGYAWFWGTASGAANALLGAITTINSLVITTTATGTQAANSISADASQNALVFDGLFGLICQANSNAYFASQATGTVGTGTPLTSDASGGIVEIDAGLKSFWDNYKLSPDTIWVNSQEQLNISKKILAGSSSAAQRFVFNVDQGTLAGGVMVRSYLNRFSMAGAVEIPIRLHPNMPPGTILLTTKVLPYPLSNVTNVLQVKTRRDYYQIEWPIRSRKYEYGVYADEVLQCYFPPAFGMITNIANG